MTSFLIMLYLALGYFFLRYLDGRYGSSVPDTDIPPVISGGIIVLWPIGVACLLAWEIVWRIILRPFFKMLSGMGDIIFNLGYKIQQLERRKNT